MSFLTATKRALLVPLGNQIRTSMISYWALGEASGTRSDSHGSNHLTDNNTVTQAAGKLGNAAQFTAANSESLSVADNASLSTGDIDFTVACWVYLDSKGANRTLASKLAIGGAAGGEWILNYNSGADRFRFVVSDGATLTAVAADTLGIPATATWYYLVAWHDSVANTLNIQANDGAVDSVAYSAGLTDTAAGFRLGAIDNATEFMDGRLDGVGFWKRVLTAAERTQLYGSGSGLEYPF